MKRTVYKGDYSKQPIVEFNRLNSGVLALTGLAFPIALAYLFGAPYKIRTDPRTIRHKREAKRERYLADLREGADAVKNYFQTNPPETYSAVKHIRITPSSEKRFLGTFIKERPLEVEVEIQNE